jgi:hypothetical protein
MALGKMLALEGKGRFTEFFLHLGRCSCGSGVRRSGKIFFLFELSGGRRDQLIFVLGLRSDEIRRSFAT